MPSINSITNLMSGSASTNKAGLSQKTIQKLLELGIDINSVSSETEAKRLIAQEEAKRSAENNDKNENKKKDYTAEEQLVIDLKNLARKLGLTASENEDITDILKKISDRLEQLNENNSNNNLNVFESELDMLKNQFKNITSGESSILSAMDILAQNNRATFNI